ncbi:Alpha-L-fucosidase [compost metagenome]
MQLAKDAGMRYIVITSKHHDGFSMFHSKVNSFNIVEATDFKRDPMIELAKACKEGGIGFGFYYSQNQDWTYPGGNGGPKVNAAGQPKTFDDYFWEKCYPEVNQITTEYGPILQVGWIRNTHKNLSNWFIKINLGRMCRGELGMGSGIILL